MPVVVRIQEMLKDAGHAALIISPVNRRYFTGFYSKEGYLLITKEAVYLMTEAQYYDNACRTAQNCTVILLNDLQKQLGKLLELHSITRVSMEYDRVTVAELTRLSKRFKFVTFDCSSRLSDSIDKLRMVKTEEELERIGYAQKIAEAALSKTISRLCPGMTEKQIAAMLNYYMMDMGADGPAFDTIAASGINSSFPAALPTDKPIEPGDFLTLNLGAVFCGYCSEISRTIVIGRPTDEMKNIYNAVWGANTDAIKAVRTDITGKVIDNVVRATLEAWSFEEYFTHGLGHGIGLESREPPRISPKSDFSLRENTVITIEPGVYIPGKYGVRIADTVIITQNGCRDITEMPKTLIYV